MHAKRHNNQPRWRRQRLRWWSRLLNGDAGACSAYVRPVHPAIAVCDVSVGSVKADAKPSGLRCERCA